MTDEQLEKVSKSWHAFRRVELYRGAPEREAAMKDELVTHIPQLLAYVHALKSENKNLQELSDTTLHTAADAVKRVQAENAAMREIVRDVATVSKEHTHWITDDWGDEGYDVKAIDPITEKARALLANETKEQGA